MKEYWVKATINATFLVYAGSVKEAVNGVRCGCEEADDYSVISIDDYGCDEDDDCGYGCDEEDE